MAGVRELAYLGFEVSDPAAWERFATAVLGLSVAGRGDDGSLALRLDERAQRIVLHPGPGDDLAYAGFQVDDGAALEALAKRLEAAGHAPQAAPPDVCRARRVERLVRLEDPAGLPLELCCGPAPAQAPLPPGPVASGFVTGDGGLGHIVIAARDAAESEHFYRELLGMRLSDRIHQRLSPDFELRITFLHANPRHHTVAFANAPLPGRLHHFMLEVGALDDVGRAHDRCLDAGVPIRQGLGRHPNDGMFSFYAATPSGFQVEVGWDGVRIDDTTWETRQYDRTSSWGHRPPAGAGS